MSTTRVKIVYRDGTSEMAEIQGDPAKHSFIMRPKKGADVSDPTWFDRRCYGGNYFYVEREE